MTHIFYILIAGLVIAGLASVWAFGAAHNANNRDPKMQAKQDTACESCALASMCTRFGVEDDDCHNKISDTSKAIDDLKKEFKEVDWQFKFGGK